jgi:hypothetical protein
VKTLLQSEHGTDYFLYVLLLIISGNDYDAVACVHFYIS